MQRDFEKFGSRAEYRITFPIETKRQVLNCNGKCCSKCGKTLTTKSMTVEHVIPLSRGGSNDIENLIPLCMDCNVTKDDKFFFPSDIYMALPTTKLLKLDELAWEWFYKYNNKLDIDKYPLISPEILLPFMPKHLDFNKVKMAPSATRLRLVRCGNEETRKIYPKYIKTTENLKSKDLDGFALYKITTVSNKVLKAYILIQHQLNRYHEHMFYINTLWSDFSSGYEYAALEALFAKLLLRYELCNIPIGGIYISGSDDKRTRMIFDMPFPIPTAATLKLVEWADTKEQKKCIQVQLDETLQRQAEQNRQCLDLFLSSQTEVKTEITE